MCEGARATAAAQSTLDSETTAELANEYFIAPTISRGITREERERGRRGGLINVKSKMLNSSRRVLLASAATKTASSRRRTGSHDAAAAKEEQSDPDNELEPAVRRAAAETSEAEEKAADAAEGAEEEGATYDLEDIDRVLAELEGEGVDDSDSSDIVLTDSSAPSYALEDRWEDVTKEVSVDEELARLEGRGLEVAEPRLMHG